ncbi:hypothetical protein [Georgenia sp. AZ-5]|uniref:hypothetical protein n=1 Tax=Georgenia sp. AZ-5 TaxID=3367526 RepID=UPI003754C717
MDEVTAAVAASHLFALPTAVTGAVLHGARVQRVPAGSMTHHAGERGPHLELVVDGVLRVLVTAPDGRTR